MSALTLIIKREFIAKVRNRSFIVMTFLSPLLFIAMAVLIGYLSNVNQGEIKKIALYDSEKFFGEEDLKNNSKYEYQNLSDLDFEKAKNIASENYEALIYVPEITDKNELATKIQYISDNSPSIEFVYELEHIIEEKLTRINIENQGIDYAIIEKARPEVSLHLSKVSGEDSVKGLNEIKIGIGAAFGYLIMMFIIIYGNFVMRSVIEEKTNRIIEVIISSVKPFQLMMGKIIGNSLAGLLQFLIWVIVGGVLFVGLSNFLGIQLEGNTTELSEMATMIDPEKAKITQVAQTYIAELWNLPLATIIISFLLFFSGGYFLYSSIYAAIGAAVDNETDSQQFMMPILMPLMLGIYIGFFTVIDDPHGSVATIFSIIPFTSPIVMLMRVPFGVPLWQLILSITLLFGTFFFVVWSASKIYRVGILMYGKKPTWKELYKWLKY